MSLRDLVSGSDVCTPTDGAGPSNAMGTLVNTLLGTASKTQEQLRELPMVHPSAAGPSFRPLLGPQAAARAAVEAPQLPIPGLHGPGMSRVNQDVDAFLRDIARPADPSHNNEFERIFAEQVRPPGPLGMPPPTPPAAVNHHIRSFLASAMGKQGFQIAPGAAPPVALSVEDACRLRDRTTILSRQLYAEAGDEFAGQQVSHLLASLNIDAATLPAQLPHVYDPSWHDVWRFSAAHPQQQSLSADVAAGAREHWDHIWNDRAHMQRSVSTGWANEFASQPPPWVAEFARQQAGPSNAWVEDFTKPQAEQWAQEFEQAHGVGATADAAARHAAAAEQSRQLAEVLSRDPKMRNSKFLQFVSKMSKGELILDENKVVEVTPAAAEWATQFTEQSDLERELGKQQQHKGDWAEEFARGVGGLSLEEQEYAAAWEEAGRQGQADHWAQEFAEDGIDESWLREFGAMASTSKAARGEYVFAKDNPFMSDPQALQKGRELFKKGLLTEAALALEAEVQQHPENAEAWRLLGTVQAENDDDQQAIAALNAAVKADPGDQAALLSLGVSYTNELDAAQAHSYLLRWLAGHPTFQNIVESRGPPPDSSQAQSHLVRLFEEAAASSPTDSEVLLALGVLHHLGRNYAQAVACFRKALEHRPQDYSLWNKLGATLANNSRSHEAISSYQQALELKPNYMRAWTNMGISYANIGDYDQSARYYVRALHLNSAASQVWGYLRTSLVCAGHMKLLAAVDRQDLTELATALPLA